MQTPRGRRPPPTQGGGSGLSYQTFVEGPWVKQPTFPPSCGPEDAGRRPRRAQADASAARLGGLETGAGRGHEHRARRPRKACSERGVPPGSGAAGPGQKKDCLYAQPRPNTTPLRLWPAGLERCLHARHCIARWAKAATVWYLDCDSIAAMIVPFHGMAESRDGGMARIAG